MSIDIKPGDGDFAVTSVGTLAPVFPLIPLGGSGAGAPAVMPGSHPSIRPTIVTVDPKTPAEGTDAPEVFKLTGAEGRPPHADHPGARRRRQRHDPGLRDHEGPAPPRLTH